VILIKPTRLMSRSQIPASTPGRTRQTAYLCGERRAFQVKHIGCRFLVASCLAESLFQDGPLEPGERLFVIQAIIGHTNGW